MLSRVSYRQLSRRQLHHKLETHLSLKPLQTTIRTLTKSSVHTDEINHFDALAPTWWDLNGSSALLHKMNPPRMSFIKSHILPLSDSSRTSTDTTSPSWLAGKRVLDIGCGGGILTEALARVGASDVTGLDASPAGIAVAKTHATQHGLTINYINASAETLASDLPGASPSPPASSSSTLSALATSLTASTLSTLSTSSPASRHDKQFDVICAMEILEHVSSPPLFLDTTFQLLRTNGLLFISTIEPTLFAKILTCTLAEDILRLVPRGTHDPRKFVPKEGMRRWVAELGGEVLETRGIIYDVFASRWRLLEPGQTWAEQCNYIMAIRKTGI